MTIKVGDKIPAASLILTSDEGPQKVSTEELFAGKKVVLFAVPGAFTPTCSARHLPGFLENADGIKQKGVDDIICLSVNDAFVMAAWAKDQQVDNRVIMAADGNGDFTQAMGLTMDGRGVGMGQRSKRYALIADDGVVTALEVDEPGAFEVSSAEAIMAKL